MGGIKDLIWFIRVGTLDNSDHFPLDVHMFTTTKLPWVMAIGIKKAGPKSGPAILICFYVAQLMTGDDGPAG